LHQHIALSVDSRKWPCVIPAVKRAHYLRVIRISSYEVLMLSPSKLTMAVAAAAIAMTAGIADADARKKRQSGPKPAAAKCYPTLEGSATGQGLFGKGTAEARAAARVDWESKSTNKYGFEYGNFDKSQNARWDCKKGAVLKAKCVVTARPCHQ
jgi:hypothetical protein